MSLSPQRREEVIDALRRGTVPRSSLDAFAVGLERFEGAIEEDLRKVGAGGSVFKAVRGEYGCGKTFFARWLADRARKLGFATSEVQVSETETPLHRLETVYRRLMERLSTADTPQGALRNIVDGWFYALEEDVLAEGTVGPDNQQALVRRTGELLEQRLAKVTSTAPMFSAALRGYREAQAAERQAGGRGHLGLAGGPAQRGGGCEARRGREGRHRPFRCPELPPGRADRPAGLRAPGPAAGPGRGGDHPAGPRRCPRQEPQRPAAAYRRGGCRPLPGPVPAGHGHAGRSSTAPRAPSGWNPWPSGCMSISRPMPASTTPGPCRSACRASTSIGSARSAARSATSSSSTPRPRSGSPRPATTGYIRDLAEAVTGRLGGKVGIAPRIFLKKLVADVLDRMDQFPDFHPRQHYALTIAETELTPVERQAMGATDVDEIELEPVSNFEQLHPAVQHHVVNSLGWRELRPFQEEVIPGILAGQHMIVLAPTAGGKTEAAFLPIASRMLSEGWTGLSVLYICPIKALLNNLDVRLQRYCTLLGRRSALWHGDVTTTARRHVLRDPPDCLLTTPESLEVMLVSPNVDARGLFSNLRVVIVDEIHAFAGDDRGWHLLSVLQRITRLAGRELQRIGLSATVGNPEMLIDWLAGSCKGERVVFRPAEAAAIAGRGQAGLTSARWRTRPWSSPGCTAARSGWSSWTAVPGRRNLAQACGNWASRPSSRTARSARSSGGRRRTPLPTGTTA